MQQQVLSQQQVLPTQEGWGVASNDANTLGKREASYSEMYASNYDGYLKDNTTKKLKDD
jgi:hypothetical protein